MTTVTARPAAAAATSTRPHGAPSRSALVAFVGVLAYLVLGPLVRLQSKAFADGAARLPHRVHADRHRPDARLHGRAGLRARSPSPWCSARCSPGPPPGCRRGCASCGWSPSCRSWCRPSPASSAGRSCSRPGPGYLNAAAAQAAVVVGPRRGTDRRLHAAVDRHHHRVRADRVRLPVRQRRASRTSAPSTSRPPRSPARRQFGVFFRVTLPLLRPTLLYGGGVALLLGLGQFTGPLLLGRTAGIDVVTTEIYRDMSQTPVSTAARPPSARRCWCSAWSSWSCRSSLLGDRGGSSPTAARRSGPGRGRRSCRGRRLVALQLHRHRAARERSGRRVAVERSGAPTSTSAASRSTTSARSSTESSITDAIYNSVTISLLAVADQPPLGFVAASIILLGASATDRCERSLDFLVAIPLGVPAVLFGAGFLLTYTEGPFVLYGTRWVIVLVYVTLMLPVRDPHAALRARLPRRGVRRGRAGQRLRRDRRQPQGRPAADARRARRSGGADVRPPHPRVRRLGARPIVDHPGHGHRALRLLEQRRRIRSSPPSPW